MQYTIAFIVSAIVSDGSLEHALKTEGPSGWNRLREATLHVEGSATYTIAGAAQGKELETASVEVWKFKRNGQSILFEHLVRADGKEVPRLAGAENSTYAFSLSPTPEGSAAPWTVLRLGKTKPSNPQQFAETIGFLRYLRASYCLYNIPLFDLIKDDRFDLKAISSEDKGAANFVRVDFSYPFVVDPDNRIRASKAICSVLLDPSRDWAIEEFAADISAAMRGMTQEVSAKCHVEYNKDRKLLPRIVTYETTFPSSADREVIEVKFDTINERQIPQTEFLLSAFGLPEMDPNNFSWTGDGPLASTANPIPSRWPGRLFWIGGNILLIVIVVALLWLRARRRQANLA